MPRAVLLLFSTYPTTRAENNDTTLYNDFVGYNVSAGSRRAYVPFSSSNAFLRIVAARLDAFHRHDSAVALSAVPCTAR